MTRGEKAGRKEDEMKDYTPEELKNNRPDKDVSDTIEFCLGRLFLDKTKSILDKVCNGLTYEELIGSLLQAKDLVEERDRFNEEEEEECT